MTSNYIHDFNFCNKKHGEGKRKYINKYGVPSAYYWWGYSDHEGQILANI